MSREYWNSFRDTRLYQNFGFSFSLRWFLRNDTGEYPNHHCWSISLGELAVTYHSLLAMNMQLLLTSKNSYQVLRPPSPGWLNDDEAESIGCSGFCASFSDARAHQRPMVVITATPIRTFETSSTRRVCATWSARRATSSHTHAPPRFIVSSIISPFFVVFFEFCFLQFFAWSTIASLTMW